MPLWSAVILLFFVMDSIGNVPLFVAVLSYVAPSGDCGSSFASLSSRSWCC